MSWHRYPAIHSLDSLGLWSGILDIVIQRFQSLLWSPWFGTFPVSDEAPRRQETRHAWLDVRVISRGSKPWMCWATQRKISVTPWHYTVNHKITNSWDQARETPTINTKIINLRSLGRSSEHGRWAQDPTHWKQARSPSYKRRNYPQSYQIITTFQSMRQMSSLPFIFQSAWADGPLPKFAWTSTKGRPSIIDSLVTVIIDGEIIKHVEDRQDSQRRPNQGNTTACLFAKRHLFSLLGIPGPQPSIYLHRTPCLCLLGYRSDCYHLLLILIAKLEESSYAIIFCWKLCFRRVRKEQNNELVHTQGDKVRTYFGRKQEPGTWTNHDGEGIDKSWLSYLRPSDWWLAAGQLHYTLELGQ